jgi:hypothetical protein
LDDLLIPYFYLRSKFSWVQLSVGPSVMLMCIIWYQFKYTNCHITWPEPLSWPSVHFYNSTSNHLKKQSLPIFKLNLLQNHHVSHSRNLCQLTVCLELNQKDCQLANHWSSDKRSSTKLKQDVTDPVISISKYHILGLPLFYINSYNM